MNWFTKKAIYLSLIICGLCLLLGCAAWNYGKDMKLITTSLDAKPLEDKVFEQDGQIKDAVDVIYLLELGHIYSVKGEFEKSNSVLEEAYRRYTDREEEAILSARKSGSKIIDISLGEGSRDYELADYEKVYLHTIKTMNYLMLGDMNNARVETMRGIERHKKIREYDEFESAQAEESVRQLKALMAAQKQATEKGKEQSGQADFDLETSVEEAAQKADLPPQLKQEMMAVRNSYENSFNYLLSAINFGLIGGGDNNNICPELRNAEAISDNRRVRTLLADCNKNNHCIATDRNVYVFAQVGLAPEKENLTIPFPNPLSKTVCQFSIARIKPTNSSIGAIEVGVPGSGDTIGLEQLTNMELLPLKEYKEKLPEIITKAVLRVIVQSLVDAGAMEKTDEKNRLFQATVQSLLSLINLGVAKADTRTWLMAPKSVWFYSGRIDGTELIISVKDKTGNLMDAQHVTIKPDKVNLINLRCLDSGTYVQSRCFSLPESSSITQTRPSSSIHAIDVSEAQRLLNQKGYNAGKVDGIIGARTRRAISSFQKDHNLPVSGKLTQETMNKILE